MTLIPLERVPPLFHFHLGFSVYQTSVVKAKLEFNPFHTFLSSLSLPGADKSTFAFSISGTKTVLRTCPYRDRVFERLELKTGWLVLHWKNWKKKEMNLRAKVPTWNNASWKLVQHQLFFCFLLNIDATVSLFNLALKKRTTDCSHIVQTDKRP